MKVVSLMVGLVLLSCAGKEEVLPAKAIPSYTSPYGRTWSEWLYASSSNVERFRYNRYEKVLRVEFTNGGIYDYLEVPEEAFIDMRKSPSTGNFLAKMVKKYCFYKRVKYDDVCACPYDTDRDGNICGRRSTFFQSSPDKEGQRPSCYVENKQ